MFDKFVEYAPMIGLIFFFVVFLVIIAWTFRSGSKKIYDRYAEIPLEEGSNEQK